MALIPHQVGVALKRKPASKDEKAPPWLSIVDGFYRLPEPSSGGGTVAPPACHRVLAAAPASLAALHGDGQNGSRLATTPDVHDSPSS